MQTNEEKLAKSLTAQSIDLIPYLPFLLQDIWELGSSPKDIIDLIQKHIPISKETRVLDLACGKGAVSVQIAKRLGIHVKGIDITPEFIDYANTKARKYGVEDLCDFSVGDINYAVNDETDYDIVILGAVGDVLGEQEETILKLKKTIKNKGYIIIDDVYESVDSNGRYLTRTEWIKICNHLGVELLAERFTEKDEIVRINDEQQMLIGNRTTELKEKYPDMAELFEGYVQSQQNECDELENEITGVTMLLKNK